MLHILLIKFIEEVSQHHPHLQEATHINLLILKEAYFKTNMLNNQRKGLQPLLMKEEVVLKIIKDKAIFTNYKHKSLVKVHYQTLEQIVKHWFKMTL